LLLVAGIALALAGCGSSGHSGTTPAGLSPQAEIQAGLSFAHCMRAHGVSNFPDPTTSPHEFKFALDPQSANARSPRFRSGVTACRRLLPDGGPSSESLARRQARIAAELAFARCLRGHGFPSFPDPNRSGELSPEMVTQAGINLHQPAVRQAADGCVSVTHGFLTRADIARAVNRTN
jgi:hypothetical protein